jgi:hypothetical protein
MSCFLNFEEVCFDHSAVEGHEGVEDLLLQRGRVLEVVLDLDVNLRSGLGGGTLP